MKKKILLASIILVLIAVVIPFNTTLVPAWKLRVVDENGVPYKGKLVRQFCDSDTLGISPCAESNDFMQETDEDGYVFFPERKITASLSSRGARTLYNFLMQIAHGSFGVDIYVDATGPQGYKTLKYVSGEPAPTELVLPSENAKDPKN